MYTGSGEWVPADTVPIRLNVHRTAGTWPKRAQEAVVEGMCN